MPQLKWNQIASYATSLCLVVSIGCGGGRGSTSTTTPTPPAQTGPASGAEFLYALGGSGPISGGLGEVYVSSLDPSTGHLTEPVDVTPPNLPSTMIEQVPPITFGKYLYAPGFYNPYHTDAIFPFSITGAQGQLTAPSNYPVAFGGASNINGFFIDGLGRYLYANFYLGSDQNAIQAFPIDQSTGQITQGATFTENFVGSLTLQAADPGGKFLYAYATYPGGIEILVYAIDPTTGLVSAVPNSPFPVVSIGTTTSSGTVVALELFVSPSGKYLYLYYVGTPFVDGPSVQNLYTFAVDSSTGNLTQSTASPFVVPGVSSPHLMFSPSGNLLYVPQRFVDNSGNVTTDIGVFKVNPTNGSIGANAVSSVSTPYSTFYPDPSGKVLLIGPGGSNYQTFWSYLVDDSTGALTPAQGSPFFANDPNTSNQSYSVVRIP